MWLGFYIMFICLIKREIKKIMLLLKLILLIVLFIKIITWLIVNINSRRELVIISAKILYKTKHNPRIRSTIILWPLIVEFQLITTTLTVIICNLNIKITNSTVLFLVLTELIIFVEYICLASMTWSLFIRDIMGEILKWLTIIISIFLPNILVYFFDKKLNFSFDWLVFIIITLTFDPLLAFLISKNVDKFNLNNFNFKKSFLKFVLSISLSLLVWYFIKDKTLFDVLIKIVSKI